MIKLVSMAVTMVNVLSFILKESKMIPSGTSVICAVLVSSLFAILLLKTRFKIKKNGSIWDAFHVAKWNIQISNACTHHLPHFRYLSRKLLENLIHFELWEPCAKMLMYVLDFSLKLQLSPAPTNHHIVKKQKTGLQLCASSVCLICSVSLNSIMFERSKL